MMSADCSELLERRKQKASQAIRRLHVHVGPIFWPLTRAMAVQK